MRGLFSAITVANEYCMARLKMKKALVVEDDPDLLEILTGNSI